VAASPEATAPADVTLDDLRRALPDDVPDELDVDGCDVVTDCVEAPSGLESAGLVFQTPVARGAVVAWLFPSEAEATTWIDGVEGEVQQRQWRVALTSGAAAMVLVLKQQEGQAGDADMGKVARKLASDYLGRLARSAPS
jgi:hypothetical protein